MWKLSKADSPRKNMFSWNIGSWQQCHCRSDRLFSQAFLAASWWSERGPVRSVLWPLFSSGPWCAAFGCQTSWNASFHFVQPDLKTAVHIMWAPFKKYELFFPNFGTALPCPGRITDVEPLQSGWVRFTLELVTFNFNAWELQAVWVAWLYAKPFFFSFLSRGSTLRDKKGKADRSNQIQHITLQELVHTRSSNYEFDCGFDCRDENDRFYHGNYDYVI